MLNRHEFSLLRRSYLAIRKRWLRSLRPDEILLDKYIIQGCRFQIKYPIEKHRLATWGSEEEFMKNALQFIKPGHVFYDIGCCLGLYAVHAAYLGARVIAFEPDPFVRERLKINIELNGLGRLIRVIDWAVSDRSGHAFLSSDGVVGLSPGFHVGKHQGSVEVKTNSVDAGIVAEDLPYPDAVKIDIEGAEYRALIGMEKLLSSDHAPHLIFLELHPEFLAQDGVSTESCTELLYRNKYAKQLEEVRNNQILAIFLRT